ncbi:hypothetical protein KC19_VG070100 [Ceratodon purpureus]|uniref:Uncharacterized protein n=1 Tax=Ceratodon purpureus TaxID=3225 RepID=A0A8T0HMS8_CERPU|nr:hypothetical protein KC19_VG070100 [Ceratodon purpureus]
MPFLQSVTFRCLVIQIQVMGTTGTVTADSTPWCLENIVLTPTFYKHSFTPKIL